jgi:DNA-nicking Smr family endonuclease
VKRRDLSAEERALWALATRDVKPAKKRARKKRSDSPLPPVAGSDPAPGGSGVRGRQPVPRSVPGARPLTPGPAPAKAGEAKKPPPVYGGGDPKADRKAAKGLIPIEARLDLHGMTEPAAHARVTRFILGAREDGLRLVLVITGKGASRGGEGRGVIRARFFDWIEQAPLRAAIARVASAKPKDGGAGAFYVFLKRGDRKR